MFSAKIRSLGSWSHLSFHSTEQTSTATKRTATRTPPEETPIITARNKRVLLPQQPKESPILLKEQSKLGRRFPSKRKRERAEKRRSVPAQGTRRRRSERAEETRPARRRWGRGTGDKKRRGEGKLGALCHHADAIGEWNLAFGGSGGAPPTKPSY